MEHYFFSKKDMQTKDMLKIQNIQQSWNQEYGHRKACFQENEMISSNTI
jgi:hypothetical protein